MTIELNHLIVPAHDKEESARFYARIFGFTYERDPWAILRPLRFPISP